MIQLCCSRRICVNLLCLLVGYLLLVETCVFFHGVSPAARLPPLGLCASSILQTVIWMQTRRLEPPAVAAASQPVSNTLIRKLICKHRLGVLLVVRRRDEQGWRFTTRCSRQ